MGYNMKRGNSAVPFSELGSSPAKQSAADMSNEELKMKVNKANQRKADDEYKKGLSTRTSQQNPEHKEKSDPEHKEKSAQTFENIKNDHDVDDEGNPQTDSKGYWKKAAKHGITPN